MSSQRFQVGDNGTGDDEEIGLNPTIHKLKGFSITLTKTMRDTRLRNLLALRKLMATPAVTGLNRPLAAYIVPSSDAHDSEYLAAVDKRRAFISGFTGSAGTALITREKALLWTDGRYHDQAVEEMDPDHWALMKQGLAETPSLEAWLAEELESGDLVGADPLLMTNSSWKSISSQLMTSGVKLVEVRVNLVDKVWEDQPPRPSRPVVPQEMTFAGKSWEDKVTDLRATMSSKGVDLLVVHALDDVAWLLNLRGSDISHNPVFFSYVVVSMEKVHLYINEEQLSDAVRSHLKPSKSEKNIVEFHDYDEITSFLTDKAGKSK